MKNLGVKPGITIAFLTLFLPVFSQTTETSEPKRLVLTTSIFDYFPSFSLNTGNFNLGTEIYLAKRNSVYINVGLIRPYGPSTGWLSVVSKSTVGTKIILEARHYFGWHKVCEPAMLLLWPHIFQYHSQIVPNSGFYLSLQSSWQWTKTERTQTVLDYTETMPYGDIRHYRDNTYFVLRMLLRLRASMPARKS